jgi:hypothetical protein
MNNLDELIRNRKGTTVEGRQGGGFLDDLIRNTREGLPVSPQDEARHKKKISADKFFDATQELVSEGTYKGKQIHPQHRKEAFKIAKKGDKIGFEKFMESVLEKKANPPIDFNGTGSPAVQPSQKLLTGTEFAPIPDAEKKKEGNPLLKFLKGISEKVGNILNIIKTRADVAEDAAEETGQEAEKLKRSAKEGKKESGAKGIGIPSPIKKMIQPVTSLWDTIVQLLGAIIIGWGITKLLNWLGDPKNAKAVEQFKDFVVTFLPPILKGLLALAALGIATKLFLFTKSIVMGAAVMIGALKAFMGKMLLFALANPWLAAGIGLAALIGGAAILGAKKDAPEPEVGGQEQGDMGLGAVDDVQNAGDNAVAAQGLKGGGKVEKESEQAQAMKGGGKVGTDKIPAMLSPGEFVMSQKAVSMWGGGLLETMNKAGGGTNLPKRANGITYAAGGGLMGGGGSASSESGSTAVAPRREGFLGSLISKPTTTTRYEDGGTIDQTSGQRVTGAGPDTQLIAAQPGEFVMSKGAVQEYGVNTLEGMNKAGGGTNKPKKATVRAATGGALVPTFSGGGQVPTFSGGGQVEDKKEKKGGLMGGITKKIMKIMDAGAMKGAMIGTVMFGPIGGIIGGGLGAVGSVIDERIAQVTGAGGSGKSADQLINNPPGQNDSGGDKDVITPVSGDNASSSPSQEEEAAPPPLFSALDERNLSTLVTKSMYSVIS